MSDPYVKLDIINEVGYIEFFHPAHNSLPGDILAKLKVATTGTAADWVVKVIDVHPHDYEENNEDMQKLKPGIKTMTVKNVAQEEEDIFSIAVDMANIDGNGIVPENLVIIIDESLATRNDDSNNCERLKNEIIINKS